MIATTVAVLVAVLAATGGDSDPEATPAAGGANADLLVRMDGPRLAERTEAVFVESVDLECQCCRLLHPLACSVERRAAAEADEGLPQAHTRGRPDLGRSPGPQHVLARPQIA